MEWAVATRHAPIAVVARRRLCSGQMRRVCRRLRPLYVPSRLDSVGAGRCSTIEPVEQAPVPPNAPAGRCPRPRWDHATQEAPVEQDRRLEAGVACVPSNAAGVASLRRVEEAHDCRSCAGPTHKNARAPPRIAVMVATDLAMFGDIYRSPVPSVCSAPALNGTHVKARAVPALFWDA